MGRHLHLKTFPATHAFHRLVCSSQMVLLSLSCMIVATNGQLPMATVISCIVPLIIGLFITYFPVTNYWTTVITRLLTTASLVAVLTYLVILHQNKKEQKCKSYPPSDVNSSDDEILLELTETFLSIISSMKLTASLWMIQFANRYWKCTSQPSDCLIHQLHDIFLTHPWIIVLAAWTSAQIMGYSTAIILDICDNMSQAHFAGNYLVWLGWLYTSVVCLLIVWPLSWCAQRIPGMKQDIIW